MKKTLIVILIVVIVLVIIIAMGIMENNKNIQAVQQFNSEYEQYVNKEIYGTEVASIINKAINSNLKNEIEQDEDKNFVENDSNSLKIDIEFLYDDETGEIRTYSMERVYYRGIQEFIRNYNLIRFKITNVEYHEKTKRIEKIVVTQLET